MIKPLAFASCLAVLASAPSAQVTEWVLAKGAVYVQTADDTPPAPSTSWVGLVSVETTNPGDATSVTLSGGGIVGNLPLTSSPGSTSWEAQAVFASQAALNASFPSATTYTLTLSGGTLGLLTQTVTLDPEVYPNVPYLTGTSWSDLQSFDASSPYTVTWNDPGPVTASSGATIFSLSDNSTGDTTVEEWVVGGTTSSFLPAGTLGPGVSYTGQLYFTNLQAPSGAGGFGVDGTAGHLRLLDFPVDAVSAPQVATRNAGSNPNSYVASLPLLGQSWTATVDLTTTGHTHAQLVGYTTPVSIPIGGGRVVLVGGTKLFTLPPSPGPSASWTFVLPSDSALAGLSLYTQAVHIFSVKPFALSNSQDLVLSF